MTTSLLSGVWLPLVINTILQSLFLLAAAAIVLVCTRKASAARRHLISVATLLTLLVAPLLTLVIPAQKPLLRVSEQGLDLQRSPVRPLVSPVAGRETPIAAAGSGFAANPDHSTEPISASPPPSPGVIVSTEAGAVAASPDVAPVSFVRFFPWLAALWLTGVLLVLGRLLLGFGRLRRLARHSNAVLPESLQTRIADLLFDVGFTHPLSIVQAALEDSISVAMTWGVWKATLLLPADAGEWPEERLRVVILHEIAHIRRYDWLTQMFGQVVCALYWFHPLVWMLNRHVQIEAERACDDAVLLAGVRAKEYAGHLLEVVKAMQAGRNAPSAAVAMARPTQVRYRLQSILNTQRDRQSPTRSVRTLVLSVTVLLLVAVSLLRPLALAGRHQQPMDPSQTKVIGPVVTLPNGVSVELVAVGVKPPEYGNGDWWTPDGKPVLELPTEQTFPFASREEGYPDQLLRRALYFRLQVNPHASKGIDFSTTGYVVDPTRHLQSDLYRHGHNGRSDGYIQPPRAAAGTYLLGLPTKETRCAYRLGVATGPWETIATTRLTPQAMPGAISIPANAVPNQTSLVQKDTPYLSYRDPRGEEHTFSLLGGHAPLGDVARRIVALDRDGKDLFESTDPFVSNKGSRQIPAWAQARIVELRLQTRPYQWAEFKDIVLIPTPSRKPLAITPPPPLPAFRHSFACGITLNVAAIVESRKEGGLWWKPDGTLLTGPLNGYENTANFSAGWLHRIRPRAFALQLTSPRTLTYTSAVRFVPSVPDENDEMLPGEETLIVQNRTFPRGAMHDFPPNLRQATLRYGIAAGPWRAVADIPMPTDARHAGPNGDPDGGGVMVEVPGYPTTGDVPRLRYTTTAGKYRDLPFHIRDNAYLHDVARRFVAVDKAGRSFPLQSNNGSQETLDSAGHPIPLNPANVGRTDLPVGDYFRREEDLVDLGYGDTGYRHDSTPFDLNQIREIRLEIRSYEWAEFRNIALQPSGR
ncbi:MAG: peptidase BlaR1 [Chthonomonadaceae bacterium]|nr:peptidase BlaR1 [Chthonomonadaceae bacterium]